MGSGRLPAVPGHLFSGVSPVLQEVRLQTDRDRTGFARFWQNGYRNSIRRNLKTLSRRIGTGPEGPVSTMSRAEPARGHIFITGDDEKSTFLKTEKRVRTVEADTDKEGKCISELQD